MPQFFRNAAGSRRNRRKDSIRMNTSSEKNLTLEHRACIEKRTLVVTITLNFIFAMAAFVFAVYTNSLAIVIDGMYTFVDGLVGIFAIKVTTLIRRSANREYPFGFIMYEPVLNLIKGLLIATVVLTAFLSSVVEIIDGDEENLNSRVAMIYAAIAGFACFTYCVVLERMARKTHSPILRIEAKQWLIDGIVSLGIGVAFFIVWIMQTHGYDDYARYADPVIVLFMTLFMAPIPIKVIKENWGQIVARTVHDDLRMEIIKRIDENLIDLADPKYELRVVQYGRHVYIQLYFVTLCSLSVQDADLLRNRLYNSFDKYLDYFSVDIAFTSDTIWIERSVKNI